MDTSASREGKGKRIVSTRRPEQIGAFYDMTKCLAKGVDEITDFGPQHFTEGEYSHDADHGFAVEKSRVCDTSFPYLGICQ